MRNIQHLLAIFFLFSVFHLYSQTVPKCDFNSASRNNCNPIGFQDPTTQWHKNTLNQHLTSAFLNPSFCVNIKVHIVNNTEGIAVDSNEVENLINNTISYFDNYNYLNQGPSGINLIWDGIVSEIDDDNFHNCPDLFHTSEHNSDEFIDLYFFNNPSGIYASGSSLLTTSIRFRPDDLNFSTIMHEIGHQFGLFHTFHATSTNPQLVFEHIGEPNELPGAALSLNSDSTGDWVFDTEAESGGSADAQYPDCDPNIDVIDPFYTPPTDNFMSYAPNLCRTSFSQGQITRMKYFLNDAASNGNDAIIPHLALVMAECPMNQQCNACPNARYFAGEVLLGGIDQFPNGWTDFMTYNSTNNTATVNIMPAFF